MNTYNDVYISARRRLKAFGIEACGLEARLIVAAAAGKTREQLVRDLGLYVSGDFERQVDELLERRLKGEPVAYIAGEWEFYGLPMTVTRDVLIPRPETETLASAVLERLRGKNEPRVLDLCCGSGCIGIAVAANVPGCRAVLVDKSTKALRVSRVNAQRNNVARYITCVDGDALKAPPMLLGSFDVIACNPPYVRSGEISTLDASVRDYEPHSALDGGEDGLDFYRSVTSYWKVVLKPGGALIYECGEDQAHAVRRIMEKNGFTGIDIIKDAFGRDRVVSGVLREE